MLYAGIINLFSISKCKKKSKKLMKTVNIDKENLYVFMT